MAQRRYSDGVIDRVVASNEVSIDCLKHLANKQGICEGVVKDLNAHIDHITEINATLLLFKKGRAEGKA